MFPEALTSSRLYTFWVSIRDEAALPGLRIHDCRHTWASQGVMNGVGLTTVGRLLGHRQRDTTAIYAHLDDRTLGDAAAQAAAIIASAMQFKPVASLAPEASAGTDSAEQPDGADAPNRRIVPAGSLDPNDTGPKCRSLEEPGTQESATAPPQRPDIDWLAADRFGADSESGGDETGNDPSRSPEVDWL